jgi:hypothetical protein
MDCVINFSALSFLSRLSIRYFPQFLFLKNNLQFRENEWSVATVMYRIIILFFYILKYFIV